MSRFLGEVREQPRALRKLLISTTGEGPLADLRSLAHRRRTVVFAGMGASLFACVPAATYLAGRGVPAYWLDASELLHYSWPALARRDTFVVLVSQSGESHEVVALAERLRGSARQPGLVAVTNSLQSPLAGLCDLAMPLHAGLESGTSSQTYVNSVALLLLMAGALCGERPVLWQRRLAPAVAALQRLIDEGEQTGGQLADFLGQPGYLPVVGRGPSFGSALASALVLKEAAGVGAEGFGGGAFRHGPFELLSERIPALIYASGRTAEHGRRLAAQIVKHGGRVVLLASLPAAELAESSQVTRIALPPLDEFVLPVVEIVPVQFLAAAIGERRGREPGALRVSGKVVRAE